MARLGLWMGLKDADGVRQPESLVDGCPGGWARCRFVESFVRYRRDRLATGAHDSNPLVHHDTPPAVLEALRYYEAVEATASAEFDRATR